MNQTDKPIPELGNRTWAELEAVRDDDGHLFIPDELRQRDPKTGKFVAQKVLVRVPRASDIIRARSDARVWMGQIKGLDPDRDSDLFDEMETLCLLAKSIRDRKTRGQLYDPQELPDKFDEKALEDLLGRVQVYRQLTDPRTPELTEEVLWNTIASVARAGHLGPLTGIAGHEQSSLVVFMARQATQSQTGLAFLQSSGISMPGPSASKNSNAYSEGRG